MKKKLYRNNAHWLILLFVIFLIGLFIGLNVFHYRQVRSPSSVTPENSNSVSAKVLYVIDGDTMDVSIDGKKERVRLIGIDAPEMAYEEKQADCFSGESADALKTIINGNAVSLVLDPTQSDRDSYGRLLRYLYLPDGTNVNKMMVEQGYAYEYTYKENPYQLQGEFQEAEQKAKAVKAGLWADGVCP